MNRIIMKYKISIILALVTLLSCTKNFEKYNTNPDAVQQVDVKSYITTMELDAVIPTKDEGANEFQRACNLMGDTFCGYLSPIQAFNGGSYTCTYDLNGTDYNDYPFKVAFTNVMPAWLNIKYAFKNGQIDEGSWAIAEVIKVMAMQRVSDIYGPIPLLHFGEDVNPYNSQEVVYKTLLEDLNKAIKILKSYSLAASSSTSNPPLYSVDLIYSGNYTSWLKLANSQKLRMAMRMRLVEPVLAQQYAQEAVKDGVMTEVTDGAKLVSSATKQIFNPLEEIWNAYTDTRMGATIDAYMNGYKDPRLPVYFKPSQMPSEGYHGVRSGIRNMLKENYINLSVPNVAKNTPVIWMLASEVAFLKAEGALLNWSMGDDAKTLYKKGIELSFLENNLSVDLAQVYSETDNTPVDFTDESNAVTKYSASRPSSVSPKWSDNDDLQVKLEKIITQKWIAMYPNGQEAWSEFRRTGYPRVIPVVDNLSGGTINTHMQIRRMTFPRSEYSNNEVNVKAAIELLGGGDNGGTKLWWDKK